MGQNVANCNGLRLCFSVHRDVCRVLLAGCIVGFCDMLQSGAACLVCERCIDASATRSIQIIEKNSQTSESGQPPSSELIPEKRQLKMTIPVALVLEKRWVKGAHWQHCVWDLKAVMLGEHLAVNEPVTVAGNDSVTDNKRDKLDEPEQSVWPGFKLVLYRDACERYWHALIGDKPLVYVVMQEDEADGSVEPALVTLDYDEALAYSETDATVLSAPIPGDLYQLMERFVLQNYQPAEFKKRKRRNWSEESDNPAAGKSASARETIPGSNNDATGMNNG